MLNLSAEDRETLKSRGITEEMLQQQVDRFKTGFPFLKIHAPATPQHGITVLDQAQEKEAVDRWQQYLTDGGTVCKFVPASGAASRMFKALFAFVDSDEPHPAKGSDVAELIDNIHQTAFFDQLNDVCRQNHGMTVDQLIADGREKDVISGIIGADGLNYGALPKGLLTFHRTAQATRTPVEEQLVEGAQSASQADGTVNMHLTVSGSHRSGFEAKLSQAIPVIEKEMGVKIAAV